MADFPFSLIWQLPAAVTAGLLLNLTPCVLPAIPVKIRTIIRLAGTTPRQRATAAAAFMVGALALFVPLAVATAFLHWTWGGLFRIPGVQVLLVLTLSIFAVMTWYDLSPKIPLPSFRAGAGRYSEAFLSGFLGAVLGTPCAGPFLAGTLAIAITQQASVSILLFVGVAIGLCLPYIALLSRPDWLRWLPKSGPWLIQARRGLAWILLASAIFFSAPLVSVPIYRALWWSWFALLAVWTGWLWCHSEGPRRLWTVVLLPAALGLTVVMPPFGERGRDELSWISYHKASLPPINETPDPYLVEFTADWCINCKILEKTVYSSPQVARAARRHGLVALRVDLTRSNPKGETLLNHYGGNALPFAVIVSSRGDVVGRLGGLFSASTLIDAIRESSPTASTTSPARRGLTESAIVVHADTQWETANHPAELATRLAVKPGWHVNANPASLDFLVATRVTAFGDDDARLGFNADYPPGLDSGVKIDGRIIRVYEDGTTIHLAPKTPTHELIKHYKTVIVKIRLQACNDKGICLAPSVLENRVPVHRTPSS